MAKSERDIQRAIMLETCDRVDWQRNNIGIAFHPDGSKVAYGVGGPGGSDLIGILRGPGTFVACEVKPPGWKPRSAKERARHLKQQKYLARVRRSGGLGFVARSVADVLEALP